MKYAAAEQPRWNLAAGPVANRKTGIVMAKVSEHAILRRHCYPWDSWFDGSTWEVVRGVDFPKSVSAGVFRKAAITAAKRKHKKLATQVRGDSVFIAAITEDA